MCSDGPILTSFKLPFTTKELVFRRPSARHFTVPQPLPFTEQVTVSKLSVTFSPAAHVEHIFSVANQRIYLLARLKSQELMRNALHISTAKLPN